jgi:hypothetical protein
MSMSRSPLSQQSLLGNICRNDTAPAVHMQTLLHVACPHKERDHALDEEPLPSCCLQACTADHEVL